jgi:hypothetical protein
VLKPSFSVVWDRIVSHEGNLSKLRRGSSSPTRSKVTRWFPVGQTRIFQNRISSELITWFHLTVRETSLRSCADPLTSGRFFTIGGFRRDSGKGKGKDGL